MHIVDCRTGWSVIGERGGGRREDVLVVTSDSGMNSIEIKMTQQVERDVTSYQQISIFAMC